MRLKQCIFALVAMLLCAFSANAQESVVAKIGSVEYTTFASAMADANAATGNVTVEVYGAVEFVDGMELAGSYTAITFTGMSAEAKITINQTAGGDYLEAHGKTVAFNDLILAKANPAWSGNSGHMGNYFSIQGGTVTYTDCTFPNGACTNTGTAVYNNCTFENASEYGLWVYDDALVTVNGGTIDSKKGIKVYSEGEQDVTSTLTVQNATFTENVTAKPAVAVGYAQSITLIGNTYNNTTAHVELDSGSDADCEGITFVAQDTNGNDISSELTVVDRSNSSAPCGVLVGDKIYTTVTEAAAEATSGSTVTLLYNSTEDVELPEGVALNKNGFTAENVTVATSGVAQVGDTTYATLAEAVAAAQAGDEIVLLSDVAEDATLPAGVKFNGNGKAVGSLIADGEITFTGVTKATSFGVQYTNTTVNIVAGACLEITGSGRMVIGHGCTFNITGNIENAKTADVAALTPSLIMPGASFTGAGVTFNVTNAYISAPSSYCSSSSSASGTFDFNIENSIWEQFGKLAFESQSVNATVNFDLKNSVLNTTSHLVFGVSRGEVVIDNSNVNVGTSRQIENQSTMTIKNGAVVNGAVATSSNAKNPGTITVENATYAVTGEFSGSDLGIGTLIVKKGATVSAGSITKANIKIDATGMAAGDEINLTANLSNLAGSLTVINNDNLDASIVDGKIVLAVKPVAKIGETTYATLAEAISAAKAGDVVTVFEGTYAVPAMKAGITIVGEGNVLFEGTLSGTLENLTMKNIHIKGGNAQRWAYAKGNLLFENVTFEATSVYALHFDGITEGTNLTYKNCTIIGWAALGGSPASCVFDGCTIKDNGAYGVIRTYFDTTIENCTFDVANANTTDVYEDGIHAVEGANVVVDNCTNVNGEMKDLVNVSGASVVSVDGVEIKNVAQVGETKYTDLQEAIKDAAPAGTVDLLSNVVVDEWIMFSETLSIGNGDIITTQINGLTINGNGKTVTIKDIESAGNGARLFYDATNLNINDLTFNFVDNAANLGGIGLTAGTINNVTFNGGGYAIFPGTGAVTIEGCTFKTNGTSIYYEEERDNLVVTGNTFENPANVNVILLRGNTTFTDNNVISGRTVNVVSGSPVVTGNDFNDVRFKVYNVATATIENNTINTLAFNDESVVNSTFDSNTLSAEAQAVLDAANFPVAGLLGEGTAENPYLIETLKDLKFFRDDVNTYTQDGSNQYKGKYVKLTADIDLAGENWEPIGKNSNGDHQNFLGTFYGEKADGTKPTISNLYINADGDYLGFFARVGSYAEGLTPTVKNIKFNNVDVSSNTTNSHGGSYVAGVIANAGGNSVVSGIEVTGDVYVVGYGYIGGIVGHGYPDIDNCHVAANDGSYINSHYWCVGGIIGYAGEGGTPITNSSVSGVDIWSAYGGAAAIAGLLQDGNKLENVSASNVDITSNSDYYMGYIAGNGNASTMTGISIENVTATAEGNPITPTDAVAKVNDAVYFSLQAALDAAAAGTGNVTVEILADVNLTGIDWNPVTVSAAGYPVVTVEGGNHTITGLNDMLFHSTWAGNSGLIIKNLTIANSVIVNDKDDAAGTVGVGAFIGYPQASATITLDNCHLKNSSVEGGHWTGGLIGMAGGYNGEDGPVFMNLTIKGCSVTGSTITGKGSVGGVIGHGSCSAWTNVVIEETTVEGNTITSTGSSNVKAGAIMGTIGAAGQPTTANGVTRTGGASVSATVAGNTVTSNGTAITTIYGRQGTPTGQLYVAGGSYDNYPIEQGVAYAAPIEGYEIVENADGTYGIQEIPAYVAKIGDVEYTSLQAAIEAVQEGETVTLLADVNVTTPAYGQNALNHARAVSFTLDLNGKELSADTGNSVFRFNITNSGATSNVTLDIKNGTIVSGSNTWCTVMAAGISTNVKAVMNLEDLTIVASKAGDLAVKAWDNATINAKNVTVNTTNGAGGFYALGGEIVLDNCTVNQKGLHTAPYNSMAFAVSTNGKMTVNSGTYSAEPTAATEGNNQGTTHGSWVGGVMNSGGTLIINGGTFSNGNFGDDALATAARGLIFGDTNANIEIKGGTFNALKSIFDFQNNLGGTSPVFTIYGGTYSANPSVVTSYGSVTIADGYVALPGLNGNYVVGVKPTATVNNLGMTTIAAGDYMVYGGGTNTVDMPLSFVMQFLADQDAEDMDESPFADWYGDFVITFTGIESGSFTADGCYLAGHYGSFGWVKVPVDGMVIEEGARYPVMLGVGLGQKYDYICSSVQDFKCALYLTPEILEANPNIEVKLELAVVDNSKGSGEAANALVKNENVYSVTEYTYDADDFVVDPNYIAELVIDDAEGENYTNDTEKRVGTLTYKRTLFNGKWNALYLPFEVELTDELLANYDFADYNQMISLDTNGDRVPDSFEMELFIYTGGTLDANYPYFVRPKNEEACSLNLVLTDATLYPANENSIVTTSVKNIFKLSGTYSAMDAAALAGKYAISIDGDWSYSEALKPYRLYLTITDNNGAVVASGASKSVRIVVRGEDGFTGIEDVTDENVDEMIYDLQGRRILEPQKGEMYIINGKKVIY